MNIKYFQLFFLLGLFTLSSQVIKAQSPQYTFPSKKKHTTLSPYNSLKSCGHLSGKQYPIQAARFTIDKPGRIKKITLHLDGEEKGTFKMHIYGQESGTNYPALSNDLIPPITKKKRKAGYQAITIKLKTPLVVTNDQFYIALDNFSGDFGLKQDSTYYEEYCCSRNGGNYYPIILVNQDHKYQGENCYATIDVKMEFVEDKPPFFEDVTKSVGLPIQLSNEHIAWGDLDGDNWLDLIVSGRIYKNTNGTFKDITSSIAKNRPSGTRGAAFIDMNNDGKQDVLLMGTTNSLLYINEGNGDFTQKEINIPPLPSLHAFSIADINQDHFPDIILAQLWEPYAVPQPNFLLLNDHQNNFTDITQRLYPQHDGQYNFPEELDCISEDEDTHFPNNNKNRRSRGTQFTDFDLDGDADLYISNYFLETDEFYKNDGNGFFTRILAPKPAEQSDTMDNHGTGVDWYDFDNDGDFDLLLPQLAHPRYLEDYDHRGTTLFRNDNGTFTDLRDTHGIEYEETHAGGTFGDVNNDGLVDIITTLYYGCRYVDLYLQQPNHRFQLNTYQSGFSKLNTGNDACFVDFNNDGLLDLAMGDKGKFRLFQNIKTNKNNWVKIQLESTLRNHFGIGAIVKVYTSDNVLTQEVNAGRGQRMQKPYVLHFGLDKAKKVDKIEVYWNNKTVEIFKNISINQFYELKEGTGKSRN